MVFLQYFFITIYSWQWKIFYVQYRIWIIKTTLSKISIMSGYIFMEQVIQLLYNAHYAFDNGEFFFSRLDSFTFNFFLHFN